MTIASEKTRTLPPLARYALGLGDDALILSQRLCEWIADAPQIEEDLAIANVSLDLLGQARTLLAYAGEVEGQGRDEDDMAYLRDDWDFLNVHMVEAPNGDFACTMARLLAFSAYQFELYSALRQCGDQTLAGLAAKALKEVTYHREHATLWVLRLAGGTDYSRERMKAGLDDVWPYVNELFESSDLADQLPGVLVDPAGLRAAWDVYINRVLAEADLSQPEPHWHARGGRRGYHSEHLGHILAEMQHLHRSHPGAEW